MILAYKDHVSELVDISDEDRNAFFADVAKVARALHSVFHPDKVNYGAYGDTGCHLHMHLVPKYNGGDEWGSTFQMNPDKVYLTDEEYEAWRRRSARRCKKQELQKWGPDRTPFLRDKVSNQMER